MKIQQGEEGVKGGPAAAASRPQQSSNMRGRVGEGGLREGVGLKKK